MYQIDSSGNVGGQFTNGVPGVTPATVVDGTWLNTVQAELLNILTAAGIAPVKGTNNQVITALQQIFPVQQAWKRQYVYASVANLAAFEAASSIYNVGILPATNGAIFEESNANSTNSTLYSMVVDATAAFTATINLLYADNSGMMYVDGVSVGGYALGSGDFSLTSFTYAFTVGTHVVQWLTSNSSAVSQLIVAEWMAGEPVTWLRAATA